MRRADTGAADSEERKPQHLDGQYAGIGTASQPCVEVPCAGQLCPACHRGILHYNGMLDLVCTACDYRGPSGGFT